jgi:hypothetical protein
MLSKTFAEQVYLYQLLTTNHKETPGAYNYPLDPPNPHLVILIVVAAESSGTKFAPSELLPGVILRFPPFRNLPLLICDLPCPDYLMFGRHPAPRLPRSSHVLGPQ